MKNSKPRSRKIQRPLTGTFCQRVTLPGGEALEFVLGAHGLLALWDSPSPPPLTGELLEHYRKARDAFIARVGLDLGLRIMTVEMPNVSH